MTTLSSAFGQDDLNDIFLRAFKDFTKGIVHSLSTNANDTGTATAVQTIVAQLNCDYSRLIYLVDVIQDRIYRDVQWASTAVAVYDMLATSIDPYFSHPSLPLRGPFLIQHQLMKALQAQFTAMVEVQVWSAGFTYFLAQLCQSKDSIGRLTPGIMLHIIFGMVDSAYLFSDSNLDLLFEIINAAGPVLDAQAPEVVNEFGRKIQRLQELVRGRGNVFGMAVFGLVRLRELGWNVEVIQSS